MIMTSLFQYAFIKGSKLSAAEQEALANKLLAELENQETRCHQMTLLNNSFLRFFLSSRPVQTHNIPMLENSSDHLF